MCDLLFLSCELKQSRERKVKMLRAITSGEVYIEEKSWVLYLAVATPVVVAVVCCIAAIGIMVSKGVG